MIESKQLGPVANEHPVFDIIHTTRAMRRLKPDPVPDTLLQLVLEAGSCAPSGGNRQPWRFVIVKDYEIKARIQPYYLRAYEELIAPVLARSEPPAGVDPDRHARQHSAIRYLSEHLHDAPVWIVPCADQRDVTLVTSGGMVRLPDHQKGASIYPAVQNMLLAARALGLGAVMTTRHLAFHKEVEAILGLPEGVESYAIVPIGYPVGNFGPVRRAALEQIVYLNQWESPHPPFSGAGPGESCP